MYVVKLGEFISKHCTFNQNWAMKIPVPKFICNLNDFDFKTSVLLE